MTLQHIDIDQLTVSPLNVRKYGAKDCADLVNSIRALGMLQPLLVRAAGDGFEVIAGQRRLNACRILAEEDGIAPIPCLVMDEGGDAAAIEASLAENIERLPMDTVDQYKAFTKLIKEGRSPEDIAQTFGITERMVAQRLALGRLHPPILTAYRKGDIHARDIRILTMASAKQQRAWWALVKDEDAYAPTGQRLKDWLFGGSHIPVGNAIFDTEAAGLAMVSDFFSKDSYFADSAAFWTHQNAAIAARAEAYRAEGWEVVVMEVGAYFATWDYRSTAKEDGGKVFIATTEQGEVAFHEGYITQAEARRRDKAARGAANGPKPELTKAAQNYVDLHRHAAVRADLLGHSGLALRLIAAHMIAGSALWRVEADPARAAKPEIAESLDGNTGHRTMAKEREEIRKLLGLEEEDAVLDAPNDWSPRPDIADIFTRLQAMEDEPGLRLHTFLMAESLEVYSPLIDTLAEVMKTHMAAHWQAESLFFELIRDKRVLNAMVCEFAGDNAAKEHVTATAKTQRAILTACLDGTRAPADPDWQPRYMAFPQGSYRADPGETQPDPEADQHEAA